MQALLSTIFGAFLAVLIWGLTFVPSATLGQGDDFDATGNKHSTPGVTESDSGQSQIVAPYDVASDCSGFSTPHPASQISLAVGTRNNFGGPNFSS